MADYVAIGTLKGHTIGGLTLLAKHFIGGLCTAKSC